jgi:integrase/recombinase XerD
MLDAGITLSSLAIIPAAPRPQSAVLVADRTGGRAKTLDAEQFRRLMSHIDQRSRSPEADRLKVLLSFAAGLRVCEISGLQVFDVTGPDGRIADTIHIRANETKGDSGRDVPMNRELKHAIQAFRRKYPQSDWLAISDRKGKIRHQKANALTVWFRKLYINAGLKGCSSHSGRRTFITQLARKVGNDFTLKDIQRLVGHARLDTTEAYIDGSPHLGKLVDRMSGFLGHKSGRA